MKNASRNRSRPAVRFNTIHDDKPFFKNDPLGRTITLREVVLRLAGTSENRADDKIIQFPGCDWKGGA